MTKPYLVAGILCLAACASHTRPAAPPRAPGPLVSTAVLAPAFLLRQRLHGRYQGRELALDVVLQLSHHELTLLGLTPFGSRAFVLRQRGSAVEFENFSGRELPFDPRYILEDVQRVLFRGESHCRSAGWRERIDAGELLREHCAQGYVLERTFAGTAPDAAIEVTIHFRGPPAPVVAPHVELVHRRYDYQLTIDTVEQRLLEE